MADKNELIEGSDVAAADVDKTEAGGDGKNKTEVRDTGSDNYIVGGYKFAARSDYERALKEQETINYITANTNFSDAKSVLKIYNRAAENNSFKTAIGTNFMKEMRDNIVGSGILEEKLIAPIPVQKLSNGRMLRDEKDVQIKRYREAYENADAGRKIRNIIIAFLAVIIVAMLIITYMSRYSVFTYFTDYKSDMENEIIDKYENWQHELEKREAAVKEKEDKNGIEYDSSIDESVSDENESDDNIDNDNAGGGDSTSDNNNDRVNDNSSDKNNADNSENDNNKSTE